MIIKNQFCIILIILLCCTSISLSQPEPNNWGKLNLSSTTIAGAKVFYEKSFEPNLPFFEKEYKQALAVKDKQKVIGSKKEQILVDINRILGIKEPPVENQEKVWTSLSGYFPSAENMTFYLVKQSTIKDFLRAGGQLPNFKYDKATDMVAYNPYFEVTSKDTQDKAFEFALPIESAEKFENNVGMIFKILGDVGNIHAETVIHEITEISMLVYIKQTDQYWRWFSDGFSDAITYELLKKHFDNNSAEEYIKERDTSQYKDIEKEINLRYWMSGQFGLLGLDDTPTEKGNRFTLARYAYATLEARRLIDKYGIDCVHKILDEVTAKQSRTGDDLIETIKNVTGEDMKVRLAAYQTFDTRQECIAKYAKTFNEASDKKDYEQMEFNLFRFHDFRALSEVENLLNDYRYGAVLLFKMGFEQKADAMMQNCKEFFSNPVYKNGQKAADEVLMVYALECEKPLKARQAAEEILNTDPNNLSALTIKMFVLLNDKKLPQAKETAKKIISLSKDEKSKNYQIATQILALDPNQAKPGQ